MYACISSFVNKDANNAESVDECLKPSGKSLIESKFFYEHLVKMTSKKSMQCAIKFYFLLPDFRKIESVSVFDGIRGHSMIKKKVRW